MTTPYARDMIGYGDSPPHPRWPGNARVAIQIVVNYEEGGESCILHGDDASEANLSEIVSAQPYPGVRHPNMESIYEFGSRTGFWRLHRLFTGRRIPITVFGVAMAMERNPQAVEAMLTAGWEIASHGWRWIDYQFMPEDEEIRHLERAVDVHTRVTGKAPEGFYLGRTSPNTHRITAEHGRFVYSADSYADELPYWITDHAEPLLIVPYTLDANDMRFATTSGVQQRRTVFHLPEGHFRFSVCRRGNSPQDDVRGVALPPCGTPRARSSAGKVS